MIKRFLLPLAVAALTAGIASATPITGSFSLLGTTGAYVTGSAPNYTSGAAGASAANAVGLDFLPIGGSPSAFSFGQSGSAFLANATGSFAQYNGALVSINDILLNTTTGSAIAYTSNPFITIAGYTFSITGAGFSRTTPDLNGNPTSIAVAGTGLFGDGIPADQTAGTFNIATSSATNQVSFTFTGNVGGSSSTVAPTPEPSSLALLGTGVLGVAGVLRRRFAKA